ncbi:hypothetical protein AgCh_011736 [Apium graveolens]
MERSDENLLPAVYKEVSETFGAGPSDLGYLTFIRNFVQGLASPLAGILVINYDRPAVLAFGTLCWALSTTAVGSIGGIGGGVLATVMAGHEFLGVPGWRCAFIMMASLSAFIGILVFLFVVDPRLTTSNSTIGESSDRDALVERGSTTPTSVWMESWTTTKDVLKVQTFQIIVLQAHMMADSVGFDHNSAATLLSIFVTECAIGSFVGGIIADRMTQIYPHSGRIMCAQFSAGMGIPFTWFLIQVIPQSVRSYYTFAVTLLIMGLIISWNATAANGPIFAEVVPAKHQTMIYAFDRAFEGSFSSFAAPIVGILAEQIYGYNPKSVDPKTGSIPEAIAVTALTPGQELTSLTK